MAYECQKTLLRRRAKREAKIETEKRNVRSNYFPMLMGAEDVNLERSTNFLVCIDLSLKSVIP